MTWNFETTNPEPNDTPPPIGPRLLSPPPHPNSLTNWTPTFKYMSPWQPFLFKPQQLSKMLLVYTVTGPVDSLQNSSEPQGLLLDSVIFMHACPSRWRLGFCLCMSCIAEVMSVNLSSIFLCFASCRIARMIRQERGNALLVGVGGTGKQSLTRLAAHICGYKCLQIELSRGYNYESFHEDLRKLYKMAGVEDKNMVFLFTDTQVHIQTVST